MKKLTDLSKEELITQIELLKGAYLRGFQHGYTTAKLGEDWWRPEKDHLQDVKALAEEAEEIMNRQGREQEEIENGTKY